MDLLAVPQMPTGTPVKAFAPILFALNTNSAKSIMNNWQRRYLMRISRQIDQTTNIGPSQSAEFEPQADQPYLMDITIDGINYRTMLSGLCFNEGDDVTAVVDERGSLLAVARKDQTAMSIYAGCKNGFAQLMDHLWWVARLLFWVTMIPMLLVNVGELTLNSSWDLTIFLIVLAGSPFVLFALCALLCGFAKRSEFMPAWLASSIFEALGRHDLTNLNFTAAESEAPHDGRKRPGDKGRVLYFWPADRTAPVERTRILAAGRHVEQGQG
ncbi:MAG: hypothetical protein AB1704_25090 [Pseudomonadota bacterium]|uniref:hypothetical protein n=1 Tax=Burkholderiaceae TaxID=119060 RepID=UPI0010F5A55C|nr:hypothetical protein [Burkholderia sp. 4M9327F10]